MPDEIKDENIADSVIQEGTRPSGTAKKPKEPAPESNQVLVDIDTLAEENGLEDWERAAFFRAAEWSGGKQVSRDDFMAALDRFKARRMGGGRI